MEISVLLTTFTRYETLEKTFEAIRKVKPRQLFLASDGPREGNTQDIKDIKRCREILENIDWECDIHRYYAEKNLGLLRNTAQAIKNAFQITDKLICLEDDKVATQSFFLFCKEMLEKYEKDYRVFGICGYNFLEDYSYINESYLFARVLSSGAFAFWKRSYDEYTNIYNSLASEDTVNNLKQMIHLYSDCFLFERLINESRDKEKETEEKSIEAQMFGALYINSQVNIVPTKNLVEEIGFKGTHTLKDINRYPKEIQKRLQRKSYELNFPLKHPENVLRNLIFEDKIKISKKKYYWQKIITFVKVLRYDGPFYAVSRGINRIKSNINNVSDQNG